MAEILDRLGNDSRLGKALYELLGEIATTAISKASKNDEKIGDNALSQNADSRACKSVPVSPKEAIATPRLTKSDGESEMENGVCGTESTDLSLGRPRYQWRVPTKCRNEKSKRRKSTAELKDLYSVYVGHLPSDITEDELMDLFKDIGEVIDAFVLPNQSINCFTYGFVRFMTLDEAKDAVRDNNLKLIGNREIHVELASETRKKLQDQNGDDESRQLLRKDHPSARRSFEGGDEKKVTAKIKTSLRKSNDSRSGIFGECSKEELLDNVRSMLSMIINFPMNLADATADEGEGPSGNTNGIPSEKKRPPVCHDNKDNLPAVDKDIIRTAVTGRLPGLAPNNSNTMHNATVGVHYESSDPFCDSDEQLSLPRRQEIGREHDSSYCSPFVDKVRQLLNSSPSENMALSRGLPVAKDSELRSSPSSYKSTCETHRGCVHVADPIDLGSSVPQGVVHARVDSTGLGSLGLPRARDDSPSARDDDSNIRNDLSGRSYLEVRVKNDMATLTTSAMASNDASHFISPTQNVYKTNGGQFDEAAETSDSAFVSLNQLPYKASILLSNDAGDSNGSRQNHQQHKPSSSILNNTSHRSLFSSDTDMRLPTESTYASTWRPVQNIQDQSVYVPLEKARHAHQDLRGQFESVNDETTKTEAQNNLWLNSLEQSGKPSLFCSRETSQPSLSNSSQSDYLHIEYSLSNKDTNVDRDGSSSQESILSQSSPGFLPSSSFYRSTVLNSVSSGSDSDGVNVTERNGVTGTFSKISESTRHHSSPWLQDSSPPRQEANVDRSARLGSRSDEIQSNTPKCSINDLNSAVCTNGEFVCATLPTLQGKNISNDTAPCSYRNTGKGTRKSGAVKSPTRWERILAPSFTKPLVRRNGDVNSEDKSTSLLLKVTGGMEYHNGVSSSSETPRPSATGEVLRSGSVETKAGETIMGDSAIVGISRGYRDPGPLSPDGLHMDYGARGDVDYAFQSSVSRNNVDLCQEEDDDHAETKTLKENLKQRHIKLEGLQQSLNARPSYRRNKTCNWFEDDTNSIELEGQIHDAEVLLQKKNESWTSRSCEQELAFERERLQPVGNTELLKQLSKEMGKEYLKNEICVTELKCNIAELKMKRFNAKKA